MLTKESVKDIVVEVLEIDDFEEQDRFDEDFGVDSMMVLELVTKLEKTYGISIPDDQYPNMGSLADVYAVVSSLVQEKEQ